MPLNEWWGRLGHDRQMLLYHTWEANPGGERWLDYVTRQWRRADAGILPLDGPGEAQALGPGQQAGQVPPAVAPLVGDRRTEQPEAADNMPENLKLVNSWRVGADPEFVVFDGAAIKDMRYLIPHDGPIGYDHGGRVAEIRPVASRSCSQVVRNIQKLIKEDPAALKLAGYKWRAGAVAGDLVRKECLGGHVHLDMPLKDARASLGALDAFTKQLEGVDMLPAKECEERRLLFNGQYGKMDGGDGHVRAAGRNQRLEYRAVASWLFSPKTALFCLTGYKLALFSPVTSKEFLEGPASNRRLRLFFEAFRHKDDDADRILEGIDAGGIKSWKGLHDGDVKQTWQEIPV